MKKIEIITRPEKLDEIKEALDRMGFQGMTVSEVIGCGLQKGRKGVFRGQEYSINLISKIKIEIVTRDKWVDDIVSRVAEVARTGEIGDGKIFIYPVERAVRIRTGECGDDAI